MEPLGHRFETGTLPYELLGGLLATFAYLDNLGGPAGPCEGSPGAVPGRRGDRRADAGVVLARRSRIPRRTRRSLSHHDAPGRRVRYPVVRALKVLRIWSQARFTCAACC
jgi:hypothetical protein